MNNTNNKSSALKCDIFKNVTILPMVYIDANPVTNFAVGAFHNGKALVQAHRFVQGVRSTKQLPYIQEFNHSDLEVIYGGIFFSQWGHFITETLQRMWYAKEKNLPIVWVGGAIFYANEPFFNAKHQELFQSIGIDNEHIFLTTPTKFKTVHFPEPGFGINQYAHPEYIKALGHYSGKVQKGKFVYLSRSHYGDCTNEKQIEEMLRSFGWDIVFPEKLSIDEQLEILTSSEVCLMLAGSAQHSLIFTKNSKTRFIVIPRIHDITYDVIANLTSDNYFLLNMEKHIVSHGIGAFKDKFSLDIDLLKNIIENTQNFTVELGKFSPILQKHAGVNEQHLKIPTTYYNSDISISTVEAHFYKAIFLYKYNQCKEALNTLLPLHENKELEFFMYDYFFMIAEKYEQEYNIKLELNFTKHEFLLQKISREIEKRPEIGENYIRLAQHLNEMKCYDDAIQSLQNTIRKFPQWSLPYAALSQSYAAKGNAKAALNYAKKAFKMTPHDTKIKENLAYIIRASAQFIA